MPALPEKGTLNPRGFENKESTSRMGSKNKLFKKG
jgi:hypothetical protein